MTAVATREHMADRPRPAPLPRRSLRLALVAVSYAARRDGVSIYTENVLQQLCAQARERGLELRVDAYLCTDACPALARVLSPHCAGWGAGVHVRLVDLGARRGWMRWLRAARRVYADGPHDVVLLPNLQPLWLPRERTVAVLHDLTYRVAAEHFPPWRRLYMDLLTRYWLRRGAALATISRTTGDDLARLYPASRRCTLLHMPNGLPGKIAEAPRPDRAHFAARLAAPTLEMVFVGRLNRLKGADRVALLARRLARFPDHRIGDVVVHAVGKETAESAELLPDRLQGRVRVVRHGYLSDADLNVLYRRSAFCLFLSRNEGFGLPLLEAIWQRCVPLLSDIPIFREVMGAEYPLFAAEDQGLDGLIAFVARLRTDTAFQRETLSAMDHVLARWSGGYAAAAATLLDWAGACGPAREAGRG